MNDPADTRTTEPDLTAFTASLRSAVDRFERNWMAMQKVTPEEWPERMGEGDWHEQFIMFLSGEA